MWRNMEESPEGGLRGGGITHEKKRLRDPVSGSKIPTRR
jgi:hypothetical protein